MILAALVAAAWPREVVLACFALGGAAITWGVVQLGVVIYEFRRNL
jgi:hypothetical protein